MNVTPFSVRVPDDMRAWLEARALLNRRSLNAEINAILAKRMNDDPLTKLRIVDDRGRFTITGFYSAERFNSYATPQAAEGDAINALSAVGVDRSNIILTEQEAA